MSNINIINMWKWNRYTWLCFLFIFVEQSIVAASTWSLAVFADNVGRGENILSILAVFCFLLLIVYIPSIGVHYASENAKYQMLFDVIQEASKRNYGSTAALFNQSIVNEKSPYWNNECWIVISENVNYAVETLTLLFNILFNIFVILHFLNYYFALSYLLSAVFLLLFIKFAKKTILRRTELSQRERGRLFHILSLSVANVWIGNVGNFQAWRKEFHNTLKQSNDEQIRLQWGRDWATFFLMMSCMVPFVFVLFFYTRLHLANAEKLVLLIATLPRQLSIIQNISVLIQSLVQFQERKERSKIVGQMLVLTDDEKGDKGRIFCGEIRIKSFKLNEPSKESRLISCLEDVEAFTNHFAKGRFLISGGNGTGKTSLFIQIKKYMGDKAFLYPVTINLFFPFLAGRESSTGERRIGELKAIEEGFLGPDVKVLLLDEWDTNLDEHNREIYSHKIDQLSDQFCVLEVRHFENK